MTRTTILKSQEYADLFFIIANNPKMTSDKILSKANTPEEKKSLTMKLQNLKKQGYITIDKLKGKGRISEYNINYKGIIDIIKKEFLKKDFKTNKATIKQLEQYLTLPPTKNIFLESLLEGFILSIGLVVEACFLALRSKNPVDIFSNTKIKDLSESFRLACLIYYTKKIDPNNVFHGINRGFSKNLLR